ncbi:Major facilitator superfamily domain general substrate transporter [Neofusicoccum parvum]|nr:Major facilitator superfamily domain general substrate transporter [Neofusicoccum parvum]
MAVEHRAAGSDERSPLLPATAPSPSLEQHRRKWSPAAISYLFLLVIIAGVTADNVSLPAFTRIYESIYCRQYYAEHDPSLIGRDGGDGVPEEFCKISQVQGEVAMLRAWQTFFDSVGTISLAVPWGYYADVRGRKPVLVMVTASLLARAVWMQVVCYFWRVFPIRTIWLAGLHSITGGSPMFAALAFVVVADVMPQEERHVALTWPVTNAAVG